MAGSFVYFFRPVGEEGPVKIGWSFLPSERLRVHQWWSPVLLEMVARTPGGERLEGQLHARFANQHLHGEWFAASPGLSAVIDAINAGAFDASDLPEPRKLHSKIVPRESVVAAQYTRKAQAIRAAGHYVPDEVVRCLSTYGYEPDEKARRRKIVAEFVDAHAHLVEQAKSFLRERQAERKIARKAA